MEEKNIFGMKWFYIVRDVSKNRRVRDLSSRFFKNFESRLESFNPQIKMQRNVITAGFDDGKMCKVQIWKPIIL